MILPFRLEAALMKLYQAFNADELHPEDACRCAVGNLLNQKDYWKHLSDDHGSLKLNSVGELHQNLGRKFEGYTPKELLQIEAAFLKGCGYSLPLSHKGRRPEYPTHPDTLFNGLSEVIHTLCHLEGIENLWELNLRFDRLREEKRNSASLKVAN